MDDSISPATKADIHRLEQTMEQIESSVGVLTTSIERVTQTLGKFMDDVDLRFAEVDRRFNQMDQRFDQTDQRFANIHEDIDRVLSVVCTIDARDRTQAKDHERRIQRLEGKLNLSA